MGKSKTTAETRPPAFAKRIGNTTFRVNVYFAKDTADTFEDRLLHLMSAADVTDSYSSLTGEQ